MPKIRDAPAVEVRARTSYGDITIRRSLPASGAGNRRHWRRKATMTINQSRPAIRRDRAGTAGQRHRASRRRRNRK
jgi:hypothetical protein